MLDHMVKCKVEQGYPSLSNFAKNSNERILEFLKMNDVGLMRG